MQKLLPFLMLFISCLMDGNAKARMLFTEEMNLEEKQLSDSANYMKNYIMLCDSLTRSYPLKSNQSVQILSIEYGYNLDQIASKEKRERLLLVIMFPLATIIVVSLLFYYKYKLRHERQNQDKENELSTQIIESLRTTISGVEEELEQLKKEKESVIPPCMKALEKLVDKREKVLSGMEKSAVNCTYNFVKSVKYEMIKEKLHTCTSIMIQREQQEVSDAINESFDPFIKHLTTFAEMPLDDCLLCCLSLSGFTTKECSFIRGVSSEAIRSQRARIKKRITDTFQSTELFEVIFQVKNKRIP